MPIAAPTIDMIATGANIRALIKGKGLKVADVQTVFGFNTPASDIQVDERRRYALYRQHSHTGTYT